VSYALCHGVSACSVCAECVCPRSEERQVVRTPSFCLLEHAMLLLVWVIERMAGRQAGVLQVRDDVG